MVVRLTKFSAAMRTNIVSPLGAGKDGSVFVTSRRTAVKLVEDPTVYHRERDAYRRLREKRVEDINGFQVPTLVSYHDEIYAIEMKLVRPPFIVDFASAILDEDWREDPQLEQQLEDRVYELFDERAADVMFALERLATLHGIHLLDAHPANITF